MSYSIICKEHYWIYNDTLTYCIKCGMTKRNKDGSFYILNQTCHVKKSRKKWNYIALGNGKNE